MNKISVADCLARNRAIFNLAIVAILYFASTGVSSAFPPEFSNLLSKAEYQVFVGDVNGDGYTDVLVKAKLKIVMISLDDLAIPIPLKPPSPTFVLISNNSGAYSLDSSPSQSIISSSVWQPASYEMIYGDVLGNGNNALIIQVRKPGVPSFLVATSSADGQPQLLEALTTTKLGLDLSASNVTLDLSDTSRDGRADLVVRVDGKVSTVFVADANGNFSKPTTSQDAALASWNAFCAALNSGDVNQAANFIVPEMQGKYVTALTDLGAAASGITNNWSSATAVAATPNLAMYAVTETFNGVQTIHIVTLTFDGTSWRLAEF